MVTMAEQVSGTVKASNKFKVVLLGNCGVGKTALILWYVNGVHNFSGPSTLGRELHVKNVRCEDQEVVLQIWDTAGQERYAASVSSVHYRGADAVILCYDVTDFTSFKDAQKWLTWEVPEEALLVLVGCKSDLNMLRVVTSELGEAKAAMLGDEGVKFFETSVKSNKGVEEVFEFVSSQLVSRDNSSGEVKEIIQLSEHTRQKRKCCSK